MSRTGRRRSSDEDESPRRRSRGRDREESPSRKRSSASGWAAVSKRTEEIKKRKEESDGALREFWLKDGESAIIQFLQDEPYCFDAHNVRDKNGNWKTVPCQLNNSKRCVLCSDGAKQTWRAAFKIVDYRGNWDKDKKRFKNDEKIEKVYIVGATIANQLKAIVDKRGKDLTEMVFEVTRSGEGKESSYNFETAFDDDDRKMKPVDFEEEGPSAEEYCTPPTDDEIDAAGYSDD